MRIRLFDFCFLLLLNVIFIQSAKAQVSSPVQHLFPAGTIVHANVSYANDTLAKHMMDIYAPPNKKGALPLVVFIHGGAWMLNNKYSDMDYMKNTVKGFIDSGYVLASINYRYSTDAVFPAQIQDCNDAVEYLYEHAEQYNIDKNKMAVIGFSAGGHLASLLALSNNNRVKEFYGHTTPHFNIKCVLDFYGPSDLIMLASNPDTSVNNSHNAVAILLGAMQTERPDLAKRASPVTYIDKNDPPFFIVQGEKDQSVPNTQSIMLSSWLRLAGVPNQLTIVKDAPHYGPMFDTDDIRQKLFAFLKEHIK